MQHMGSGAGGGHHAVIDLITGELGGTILGLLFLAHADPDIGVKNIGPSGSLQGIIGDGDRGIGPGQQIGWRAVEIRAGKPESEAEPGRSPDPGPSHVTIRIADESNLHPVERTPEFLDRQQVGKDLAGMLLIGQRIDGGNT